MLRFSVVVLLAFALCSTAIAAKSDNPKPIRKLDLGQMVVEGFAEATFDSGQCHLSGPKVHVFSKDGRLDAQASDVLLKSEPIEVAAKKSVLRTVVLSGSVKLFWKQDPAGLPSQYTKAESQTATVDLITRKAVLKTNVLIETTDPTMFGQFAAVSAEYPASITTDEAIISFLSDTAQQATGEPRIQIKGDSGRNKIRFTPAQPAKNETEPTTSAN